MRLVVAIKTDVRSVIAPDDRSYDQFWRTIVRSIVTSGDRSYEQSWHPSCDQSYEHSWHPVTECTINRGTRRPIVDQSWGATIDRTINRSIVRPIVATYGRSYDESWPSWHQTTEPRSSITGGAATMHDWWYDHVKWPLHGTL